MNALPQPWLDWTKDLDDRLIYTVVLTIVFVAAVRLGGMGRTARRLG